MMAHAATKASGLRQQYYDDNSTEYDDGMAIQSAEPRHDGRFQLSGRIMDMACDVCNGSVDARTHEALTLLLVFSYNSSFIFFLH